MAVTATGGHISVFSIPVVRLHRKGAKKPMRLNNRTRSSRLSHIRSVQFFDRQRAEKANAFSQLSAFAVTAICDCLQAVDTSVCVEPSADNHIWL